MLDSSIFRYVNAKSPLARYYPLPLHVAVVSSFGKGCAVRESDFANNVPRDTDLTYRVGLGFAGPQASRVAVGNDEFYGLMTAVHAVGPIATRIVWILRQTVPFPILYASVGYAPMGQSPAGSPVVGSLYVSISAWWPSCQGTFHRSRMRHRHESTE